MTNAPGLGPKLEPEQEFALETTTRLAMNAPREKLAGLMRQMHYDNMLLRRAIVEFFDED